MTEHVRKVVRQGRYKRGTERANARFTDDEIRDIRARAAAGVSIRSLVNEYGVSSHSHIKRIVTREIWGHVAP